MISGRKADGRLPAHPDGGIALRPILRAGIEALAARQRGASPDDLDLNAERARLAKEQADAQEMKNAVTRGELVPRQDVVAGMQVAFAHARARLLSLPAKAAPLLLGETSPAVVRDKLTDLVHECCGELAATRAVPAAPDRPADGGGGDGGVGGLGAASAADGERMGGPFPRAQRRGQRRARAVAD
ncbi:hypothetical protein [Caldovatus sediminis]|uniref:hypothetical protein n=1 Tax=Caldovatus sediminis TaxID=2041189 RepID=UPI001E2C84A7|nr:hypothetical protein [Caldovatus sediminis]